jgi:hypothetical protein
VCIHVTSFFTPKNAKKAFSIFWKFKKIGMSHKV